MFPSSRAKDVLKALQGIGWNVSRQKGSHKTLTREGKNFAFQFKPGDEIGPKMLSKISKLTGLLPQHI